jgi:hypothetical protein
MPSHTPHERVERAKKKIVELVGKGVRINPDTQSDFTRDAVNAEQRKKMSKFGGAMISSVASMGSRLLGSFDNSVQKDKSKKSTGHR